MDILPLSVKIKRKIEKYSIQSKFNKQLEFLKENPKHPSLNVELLEPKEHKIYSFRINQKIELYLYSETIKTR